MAKKKVLILCYNNLASDPRVQRQIVALANDFHLEGCGTADAGNPDIPFHQIYVEPSFSLPRKLKRLFQFLFRRHDAFYWDDYKKELVKKLGPNKYDVIIANDIPTLPLALAIAGKSGKVLFDSHDYHPNEFEENLKWRLFNKPYVEFLCRKYIPLATAFTTTTNTMAKSYYNYLKRMPEVVTNATYYYDLQPSETRQEEITLIHHGAALRGRMIERMIDVMKHLGENYRLHLMLTGKGSPYYTELKTHAANMKNVTFLDPVPYTEIVRTINKYDIGLYSLPPVNYNHEIVLPNKFFEFIQARLCLVIAPCLEMDAIIREYDLGIVCDNHSSEAMAKAVKSLSVEQIRRFKENSGKAARVLTAEESMKKVHQLVSNLASAVS